MRHAPCAHWRDTQTDMATIPAVVSSPSCQVLVQEPLRLAAHTGDVVSPLPIVLRGGEVSGSPVWSSLPVAAMLLLNSLIPLPIEPAISGIRFGPNTSNATATTIKRCGRLRFSNTFLVLQGLTQTELFRRRPARRFAPCVGVYNPEGRREAARADLSGFLTPASVGALLAFRHTIGFS